VSQEIQQTFERGPEQVEANVFAFIGLPGAGKSEALMTLDDVYEHALVDEVGNYVRYRYEGQTGEQSESDNDLGKWAADVKDEHGRGYFVNEWAKTIKGDQRAAHELDKQPWTAIGLAGVRSPEELDALRTHFTDVTAIVVWSKPDVRYDRLMDRDGDMDREVFHERQERELHDWGALEFFVNDEYYDYIIPNNGDNIEQFDRDVRLCVNGSKIADQFKSPPFPEGLPEENISQYL
jgi:dephospho-CoA kinase